MGLGYSLVSQQLRGLILNGSIIVPEDDLSLAEEDVYEGEVLIRKKGSFNDAGLEGRVQPSSFDPILSNELFVLDTNFMLRPQPYQSVYRTVLEIPKLNRPEKDIASGFEVKGGYSYLVRLQEKISPEMLQHVDFFRSSPKSSTGRLFPKTRLLADYNPSFDEAGDFSELINLWLLIQPLPFNFIIRPGDSLNQLRFFKGDAKLSSQEVLEEAKKHDFLYRKGEGEDFEPEPIEITSKMVIEGGLQIGLDLRGSQTKGIQGLRARRNPDPIDLSGRDYIPERFFSPVVMEGSRGNITGRGEHYLFASSEVISVPPNLSAELRRHSREGVEGRSHDAGFIDPGFEGDVVFEVTPDEETSVPLLDGMHISRLDFFRTSEIPDKVYGTQIGSSYQGQFGPKTSKHFLPFDFSRAAKEYHKLSRIVLVQDAELLRRHRRTPNGFEFLDEGDAQQLFRDVANGFFHFRYDCEDDELTLQPIPYVVFFGKDRTVFSYIRAENLKDYGDKRLFGKHSIGVGGHVIKEDGPDYLKRCLEREVFDEEVRIEGESLPPKFVGTLFATDKPVDRVHFGLIYAVHTTGRVIPNEAALVHGEMVPLDEMRVGYHEGSETETWTRILMPHLRKMYEMSEA